MNKCLVLSGLFINLIGVILLFYGMRVDKDGAVFSTSSNGKKWNTSYPVMVKTIFLHIGLALVCFGIVLQIIGTWK